MTDIENYKEFERLKFSSGIKEIEIRKELRLYLEMRTRLVSGIFIESIHNDEEAKKFLLDNI